ncbi:MAG: YdbL family protein [Rickettsiales bacterium]|nr:YdbL family protein [Pseudomonadota bacterium]MDA0965941.1 YdbL family protein [Pseudomonadota bacterium]MDG4542587.1 YdbL family protein [Rickettsiales bacterium]MDG4545091.1 YdbL family protein [Rickettsiales bacterium]MDG4547214.1 YdbL family protein [Rickettsiales bacterium]
MNIVRNFIVAVTVLLSANMANALDLATAKTNGLVGEQNNGYIGAVKSGDEVTSLVEEINAKRKEAYKNISAENGQPLDVVETLAAKKLYEKLQASEYYQSAEGKWLQK